MQQVPTGGPHILGFDVIWVATMLSAVATFAVMLAIYAATTVRDPMARRVKALNERREHVQPLLVFQLADTRRPGARAAGDAAARTAQGQLEHDHRRRVPGDHAHAPRTRCRQ